MKPLVLCILDGVGMREDKNGNAVKMANMPNFRQLVNKYPHSLLEACGTSVGLPDGQMGNSEVGHTNIGAGRVVYQPLEQINMAIKDKSFYSNEKIIRIINKTKESNSRLHIFGLLSDGGIHSHINHLYALLDLCQMENMKDVYIHIFTDGRDTLKDVAINFIEDLEHKLKEIGFGTIATISGRYYAMDRDGNYDRLIKSYDVITKKQNEIKDYKEYIKKSYEEGVYDEFIKPIQIDSEGIIKDNDNLITFNFRPDRLRELFGALTNNDFKGFETIKYNNVKLVSMMHITDEVVYEHAFNLPNLNNTLGTYISKKKLKQLRIAETEKYAHVTYFFDGGTELELKGEDKILIPSSKVATYDLKPSMSANEITDTLIKELDKNKYDVVILNYANGDMVGHTGNLKATVEALESLDICLGHLYEKVKEKKGTLIITADHGNSDYMVDDKGNIITSHSMSKVPFIITNEKYKLKNGKLADIAPTILDILNLKRPKEMTGGSLITNKKKKRNYFFIISLLVAISLFLIYTTRLIHYYRLEHQSDEQINNCLSSHIINSSELSSNNGLVLNKDEYMYKGDVKNNYVKYSGELFRIIKINKDNSIKMITDDVITPIIWNYENNDFEGSYIDSWLSEFYTRLSNPDNYITEDNFCIDKIDKNSDTCKKTVKRKVGLITYQEYKDTGANKGFLNIGKYFWTINGSKDDKVWYVFDEGGVSDNSNDGATYYSYGVRPVINLKPDVSFVGGDGTRENPYTIEQDNNGIKIGEYINYSNLTWKVIDNSETYRLVLDSYLNINGNDIERQFSKATNVFSLNDYYGLANYLNTTFYNTLDKTHIVDGTYYTGALGDDFNYKNIYNSSISAKVGLLSINEVGYSDLNNYFTLTPSGEELVYSIKENGMLYASNITDTLKVVPVINISKEVSYENKGTKEDPYIIK